MLLDIETSPIIGYTWGVREIDVIKRIKTFTILSVAYQWLEDKTVRVLACDTMTERQLLARLHALLHEAEIVVAHNGESFDIKKINARLITHRFKPPSPFRIVDTRKEAKNIAAFDSNKLNELGIDLGEGEKIKHRGFDMWEGCMAGKRSDWLDMKRYNKQDVVVLRRIFLRLRPWIRHYPLEYDACRCGSKRANKRGFRVTKSAKFVRLQCLECGSWRDGDRLKRLPTPKAVTRRFRV